MIGVVYTLLTMIYVFIIVWYISKVAGWSSQSSREYCDCSTWDSIHLVGICLCFLTSFLGWTLEQLGREVGQGSWAGKVLATNSHTFGILRKREVEGNRK